jgi:phosphatidyl-myo-inositol alpha-mannosyltransferase
MNKLTKSLSKSTPKKLKIGFLLDDTLDTPDGVQQYVLTVGKWMSEQGHEVHYLVGQTARKDIENIHSMAKNVKVSFNKNKLSIPLPSNKKLIAKKLAQLELDVIHVQMPYSPLFAGRVIKAAPASTKVIGTFHIVPVSWLEKTGAKSLQLITKTTLKRFDEVVSVSQAAQNFAKTVFNLDTKVLPNVVDVSRFRHKPVQKKYIHIVCLGRLVERKGQIYLLKALAQVQNIYDGDYKVTIAGKGPLLAKLNDYTAKNGIRNVKFAGFVSEQAKPKLLASADIAVFPSTGGESFGIVLIEAMAAGSRVVLGGNNIGYSSVLGSHQELLFDPKDSFNFTKTLVSFMKNDRARKLAYKWNQSQIISYDIATVGPKLVKIYNK